MRDNAPVDDASGHLLERRWFAAYRAADDIRAECEALIAVRDMAQDAWRDARSRLSQLEALRDALGEQLSVLDACDMLESAAVELAAESERSVA